MYSNFDSLCFPFLKLSKGKEIFTVKEGMRLLIYIINGAESVREETNTTVSLM